jgi:hypothetical protein
MFVPLMQLCGSDAGAGSEDKGGGDHGTKFASSSKSRDVVQRFLTGVCTRPQGFTVGFFVQIRVDLSIAMLAY